MCIIVVKPAGVQWPSWKTLENCWNRNSDGAGLMFNDGNGNVVIDKGYMTWLDFKKRIKMLKRAETSQTTVVLHFRIQTHGEVSRECCHPFPLDGRLEMLRQTEVVSNYGVAHNGVISGRATNAKKSDTMDYILNVLYPLSQITDDFTDNKYIDHLIDDTIDPCRLAILHKTGRVDLYGTWNTEAGVHYSNTSFQTPAYTRTTTYANGYYYTAPASKPNELVVAPSLPAAVPTEGMSEQEFDAYLAEIYGFGADDDPDLWEEDYKGPKSIEQAKFFSDCPSPECTRCPEYFDCVDGMEWVCRDKLTAESYLAWMKWDESQVTVTAS